MPTKEKLKRETISSVPGARKDTGKVARTPAQEAKALEQFKRMMTKYRGKCSFAGLDE